MMRTRTHLYTVLPSLLQAESVSWPVSKQKRAVFEDFSVVFTESQIVSFDEWNSNARFPHTHTYTHTYNHTHTHTRTYTHTHTHTHTNKHTHTNTHTHTHTHTHTQMNK
jgi:hypothetical protein